MSELYIGLPTSTFATVVIDPPWPITLAGSVKRRPNRATALPYKTLTVEDIKAFPLAGLCEVGCHVYLWTTNKFLPSAFTVLESWGVRYHLTMPLVKRSGIAPCMGYCFASEFCLLGFAGRPMLPFTGIGKLNWLETNPAAGKHSAKPAEFYSLVEAMSPEPRLDLFARQERSGWTCWGDELEPASQSFQ